MLNTSLCPALQPRVSVIVTPPDAPLGDLMYGVSCDREPDPDCDIQAASWSLESGVITLHHRLETSLHSNVSSPSTAATRQENRKSVTQTAYFASSQHSVNLCQ